MDGVWRQVDFFFYFRLAASKSFERERAGVKNVTLFWSVVIPLPQYRNIIETDVIIIIFGCLYNYMEFFLI